MKMSCLFPSLLEEHLSLLDSGHHNQKIPNVHVSKLDSLYVHVKVNVKRLCSIISTL